MATQTDIPTPHRAPQRAFTLIEMLAVLTIVVILAALVVGVGVLVFDSGKAKLTEQGQASVLQIVETYRAATGSYPGDSDEIDGCATVVAVLRSHARTQSLLSGLSKDILVDGRLVDGWGTNMRFSQSGGLAGGPLLTSAGPDKTFDTDDDIRSDKR